MRKRLTASCAVVASVLSLAVVAAAGNADAAGTSFAAAAKKAGYSASQIAKIEKNHAQNAVPVSYTATALTVTPDPVATRAAARTVSPAAVYASTVKCYTDSGTAYGKNNIGNKLMSETMKVHFCVQHYSPYPGPTYSFHNRISSVWSGKTVTSHLSHHTFSAATVYGWEYKGLDDTGNYGPNYTGKSADRGFTVQRRASWHFDIGYGPAAFHGNCYPYIRITLNGKGAGHTYTGAPT